MNTNPLPLFQIDQPVNLLNLPDRRWTPIATDWAGWALPFTWKFFLAVDATLMHFFTRSTAPVDLKPGAEPATFTPQLWQYTVAEVFFFSTRDDSYHEFNVAPNSAWWHSKFSSYRTPVEAGNSETLQVTPLAYQMPSAWIAGISFPRSVLPDDFLVSVCGITGHETPAFISSGAFPDIEPDFHLKKCARPVQIFKASD